MIDRHPSEPLQKGRKRDIESFCQDFEVFEAHIPLATLNSADVGPIEAAAIGKSLLRQASSLPQLAHPCAEADEKSGRSCGHPKTKDHLSMHYESTDFKSQAGLVTVIEP